MPDESPTVGKTPTKAFGRFWAALNENKEQIKIISAFAASIFVIWQYLEYKYEGRIERSLSYVERLQDDQNIISRTAIDLFWINPAHETIFQEHPNFDEEFLDYIYSKTKDNSEYIGHLHKLYLLYKDISICTINNLCDLVTACKAFWPEIQQFRHLHTRYISLWNSFVHESKEYLLDKFISLCDDPDIIFSFEDRSFLCQIWIRFGSAFSALGLLTVCERTKV